MSTQKEEGIVQGNSESHKDVHKILKEALQYSQSCWQKKRAHTHVKRNRSLYIQPYMHICPTTKERYDSKNRGFWGKDVPRDRKRLKISKEGAIQEDSHIFQRQSGEVGIQARGLGMQRPI